MATSRPYFASEGSITPIERWATEVLACVRCGWSGTFKDGEISWDQDLVYCQCPRCHLETVLATLILPDSDNGQLAAAVWAWFAEIVNPAEPEEPIIRWPGDDPEGDEEYRAWVAEQMSEHSRDDYEYDDEDIAAELRGQSSDDFSEIGDWDEDGAEVDAQPEDMKSREKL